MRGNATAAARTAGYSDADRSVGWSLTRRPHIRAAIAAWYRRHDVTTDRVLAEMARIGFSDIRETDGKALADLDDHTRRPPSPSGSSARASTWPRWSTRPGASNSTRSAGPATCRRTPYSTRPRAGEARGVRRGAVIYAVGDPAEDGLPDHDWV